jgi:cytochrome P450
MITPPLMSPKEDAVALNAKAPGETAPPRKQIPGGYNLPPGLKHSLPFYAHKRWVKLGEPIRLFEHLKRTYGTISKYRFLGTYIVFVNDPRYIREILITQGSSFVKERTLQRMKILLGEGLITSDDPIHMRHRKMMAPAFHRQRVMGYADAIVGITSSNVSPWKAGDVVDANATMMVLSLEIIARTLFDTEVTDQVRGINDDTNAIMRLYNFLVAFPKLEQFLHLPIPGVIQFRRSLARLDAVVDAMVRTRRDEMANGQGQDRGDLLSLLVASRYEAEAGDQPGAAPLGMTDRQIRDEVLTIFLAGYETVANALTWTWYLLSQNPEVEARMHRELDEVLGVGHDRKLPTLESYGALRYTEQVFAEAMRLYPPAWAMGRKSTETVTLGEYTIPPGAHFFFSQYVMHRSPEYFPDPLRFDPERFSPENKADREKFTYFPFGGGGRQCIGESFAWMEGVLVLATIGQRWRLRFVGEAVPVPQARITLRPRGAVRMQLEARRC